MPTTITGTDGVSQVQAGAVESGDLPAGSVLQVKHVVSRTAVDIVASGVVVDLGLSINITPTSLTSKFLLLAKIQARLVTNGSGFSAVFFRNGSEVRSPGDYYEIWHDGGDMYTTTNFQYFDEPSTLSSVTYEVKPETYSNSRLMFSQGSRYDHNLTVMEIAG